ncbi:MAG: hypothetical protein WAU68_08060 [Vitreimonas sp.]
MRTWPACVLAMALVSACDDAPDPGFAGPNQIRLAAERCGLRGFAGNRAGVNWDANVPHNVENWVVVEDCIYDELDKRGLRATRAMNIYEWDAAREASGCRRDPTTRVCVR